jgi:hypothetical protein
MKGGACELGTALARKALANVARPFTPRESFAVYPRDLFGAVNARQPGLGEDCGPELSDNHLLNPLVPERILVALAEAGVADEELGRSLELVMAPLDPS